MSAKFVYFIRPVGMDGPIKIGCSHQPEGRLATFSPWSPYALELIGKVPGTLEDERFLHHCFADTHSHREWFHSSPKLREAIRLIITAGSIIGAREYLTPQKAVRKSDRIVRDPAHQCFLDLQASVRNAARLLRKASEKLPFAEPLDVSDIVRRWNAQVYGSKKFTPTDAELARVNEFVAEPAKHAIFPKWFLERNNRTPFRKAPILVPHLAIDEVAA